MIMDDLINEIQAKSKQLSLNISSLKKTGREYANAYSKYRIELAKELLRLRDSGMPVTMAYDVARGNPEIAKLKQDEISKETIYKANQESINAIKLQIKILDNQIQREWGEND